MSVKGRAMTMGCAKRMLSVLLCFVLVVSMVPSSAAWALGQDSQEDAAQADVQSTEQAAVQAQSAQPDAEGNADDAADQAQATLSAAAYKVDAACTGEGTVSVSAGSAHGTSLASVTAGTTVTISAEPAEGYYLAQVRLGTNAVAGNDESIVYEPVAQNTSGAYSFTMPEQNATVYADFVSIVWDGTMDVTWYNTTDSSFNIQYAAQYAGLAAIVNGIFNNYPTSANSDGIQICDYNKYLAAMGTKWLDADGNVVTSIPTDFDGTGSDGSKVLGSAYYGEFTATNTIFNTQGQTASSSLSVDIGVQVTSTQRLVGNTDYVKANFSEAAQRTGSLNQVTTSTYFFGIDYFNNKTVNVTADLDFGATKNADGTWDVTSPLFMPVAGQFIMLPLVIWEQDATTGEYVIKCSNGYNHIGSSFCGTLDGHGHSFSNIYCERYGYGSNFGDSQSVGLVGRLGIHDNDYKGQGVQPPVNPTVRCIVVESGYIASRRGVGGIVGKIGHTSATDLKDGSTGGIIEYCINKADTFNTDAKGVAGICGASWNDGAIRYCANFGTVTSTYADPEGGIVGYNENDIINCYNVGNVVNTNTANARFAMGIASNNGGTYTIKNNYWLLGSAQNDYLSTSYQYGGYYGIEKGTEQGVSHNGTWSFGGTITTWDKTVTYSADYPTLTAALLNDGGAEMWKDDTTGINDGYPVLYYQTADYSEQTYNVTVEQPAAGGTISVDKESGIYGTVVTITPQAEGGYVPEAYMVNGTVIEGNSFIITGDATVSATFVELQAYAFHYDEPDTDEYTISASKTGTVIEGGTAVQKAGVPIEEGDVVYQNDVISVSLELKEGAAPADTSKEYTGGYTLKLAYTDAETSASTTKTLLSSGTLSYTVTGAEDTAAGFTLSIGTLTSTVKSWNSQADTTWYNASNPKTSYVISTAQQLAGFNMLLNSKVTFEGVTITLGNDISLANADGTDAVRYWKPQSSSTYAFKGTFDGAGHTIYDMACDYSTTNTAYAALIGYASAATVKDLTVTGTAAGKTYAAGIVGYADTCQLEDLTSKVNVSAVTTSGAAGGVVAFSTKGSLDNCVNLGTVSNAATSATAANGTGGVCGYSQSSDISGCMNHGAVTGAAGYVGGIVGYASASSYSTNGGTDFSQCGNTGSVSINTVGSAAAGAGGICGYAAYVSIAECFNSGAIAITGGAASGSMYAGGLVGYCVKGGTAWTVLEISDSFNVGAVSASSSLTTGILVTAGLVGYAYSAGWNITNCYSAGSISATGGKTCNIGQLIGLSGTHVSTYTYAMANTYYVSGASASADDAGATAVAAATLKGYASKLGANYIASTAAVQSAYPTLSAGYPVHAWLPSTIKTDMSTATIAPIADQTYTGVGVVPALTVTLGGKTLVAGTDYRVTCTNNVSLGTATATAMGIGSYAGSVSATFTIVAPTAWTGGLNDGTALGQVKAQLPAGFVANEAESADIRLAFGIDSLDYQSVGLLVSTVASDDASLRIGETGVRAYATTTVYSKIYVDGVLTDASTLFAEDGTRSHAAAVKLTGIPSEAYNTTFNVRAFAIRDDGTVVYGTMRAFNVREL